MNTSARAVLALLAFVPTVVAGPPANSPALPSSPRFADGITRETLVSERDTDPLWKDYLERRASVRKLASELDGALAAAKPGDRSRIVSEWKARNKAELERFNDAAEQVAEHISGRGRSGQPPGKAKKLQSEEVHGSEDAKRSPSADGKVEGKVDDLNNLKSGGKAP